MAQTMTSYGWLCDKSPISSKNGTMEAEVPIRIRNHSNQCKYKYLLSNYVLNNALKLFSEVTVKRLQIFKTWINKNLFRDAHFNARSSS